VSSQKKIHTAAAQKNQNLDQLTSQAGIDERIDFIAGSDCNFFQPNEASAPPQSQSPKSLPRQQLLVLRKEVLSSHD